MLPFARLRSGAHGGDQPQQYQPMRVALRRFDRRRRPSQMALEDLGDVSRRPWLGRFLSKRCRLRGAAYGNDGAAAAESTTCAPRGPKTPILYSKDEKFPVPGFKVLRQSAQDKVTVIGAGITLHEALKAADELKAQGDSRPRDRPLLRETDRREGAGRSRSRPPAESWSPSKTTGPKAARRSGACGAGAGGCDAVEIATACRQGMPHSGKPDEFVDAFGISARHIAAAVREIPEGQRQEK